jgi:hypothetical protein
MLNLAAKDELVGLQASAEVLMTRFIELGGCPKLAHLIVHQLQKILAHPQLQSLTETQNIYRRLIMHWQIVSSEVNAQRNTREQLSNVFH